MCFLAPWSYIESATCAWCLGFCLSRFWGAASLLLCWHSRSHNSKHLQVVSADRICWCLVGRTRAQWADLCNKILSWYVCIEQLGGLVIVGPYKLFEGWKVARYSVEAYLLWDLWEGLSPTTLSTRDFNVALSPDYFLQGHYCNNLQWYWSNYISGRLHNESIVEVIIEWHSDNSCFESHAVIAHYASPSWIERCVKTHVGSTSSMSLCMEAQKYQKDFFTACMWLVRRLVSGLVTPIISLIILLKWYVVEVVYSNL
jgi:hypothetical protein